MRSNRNRGALRGGDTLDAPSALLQNRGVVHFLSVFSSLCLTVFIVFLVGLIPVDTDVTQYKELLMPGAFHELAPEPLEMPQYALTIVLLPCLYLAANAFFKRIPAEKQRLNSVLFVVFDVILLASAGCIGLYQVTVTTNYNYGFLALGMLLAVFLLLACYLESRQYGKVSGEFLGKLCFLVIFAVSLCLGFYLTYRVNRMLQANYYSMHHFYAWWYPVYKVSSGMTIGVDFNCLYGFYPYLVVPALKLLGGVNQHVASLYLSLLLCLISICYFTFSYKFIKSKLLAGIVGCLASFYGPFTTDYIAMHPARTLFPALVLGGVALYTSLKSKRMKTAMRLLMAPALGLGLAWNIEAGLVAVISWAGFLIFTSAEANGLMSKKNWADIVKAALLALVSVAISGAFIELATYFTSSSLIGLSNMLFGQTVFAGTGFYMVKMAFNTWTFVALPFAAGLFAALPYITKNRSAVKMQSTKAAALFTVSIVAIGAFSYYIGRSVPKNSLAYLIYDLMICGILTDVYRQRAAFAKENGLGAKHWLPEKIKVFFSAAVIGFISVWTALAVLNCFSGDYYEQHLKPDVSTVIIYKTAQDIRDWSEKNELPDLPHLLIYHSCYVNEALNRPASETVCEQIDWFYRENARTYLDFILAHKSESFVIDEQALTALQEIYPEDLAQALSQFTLSEKIPTKTLKNEDSLLFAYLPKTK